MKKIFLAFWLFMGITNIACALPSGKIIYTYDFNPGGLIGEDAEGFGLCPMDHCYDASSNACYYVDGYSDGSDSCDSVCSDNFPGSAVIYDGPIPIGCGCSGNTTDVWRASGVGRERKYTITPTSCTTKVETATNEYRCVAGYYGNGTTCTACSGAYRVNGTQKNWVTGTSPVASASASACYLTAGQYWDDAGYFTLTGNCNYQ